MTPRWEWRSFASALDAVDLHVPGAYQLAHDIYLLSQASSANVKIRDGAIDVKTCAGARDGLELWRPAVTASFPLCHREIREVFSHLRLPAPRGFFLPVYDERALISDLAGVAQGGHIVGVHKVRRQAERDGCVIERAAVSAAGRTVQSIAISAPDPDAVLRLLRTLRLEHLENINYVTFLKRTLGIRTPAMPALSKGACHDRQSLPLVRPELVTAHPTRIELDHDHDT